MAADVAVVGKTVAAGSRGCKALHFYLGMYTANCYTHAEILSILTDVGPPLPLLPNLRNVFFPWPWMVPTSPKLSFGK